MLRYSLNYLRHAFTELIFVLELEVSDDSADNSSGKTKNYYFDEVPVEEQRLNGKKVSTFNNS